MGNQGGFPGGGRMPPTEEEKKRQRERRLEEGKINNLFHFNFIIQTFSYFYNNSYLENIKTSSEIIGYREKKRSSSTQNRKEEKEEEYL